MESLSQQVINYKNKNNLDNNQCAERLNITVDKLLEIENGTAELSKEEIDRITSIIGKKGYFKTCTFRKILDLLFRFGAAIMALVVLLLCINGIAETETLIVLLSIGVVCSSITNLPKIDK